MTWSKAETVIIDSLVKQSDSTAENVREIKEAIVGSISNGGKAGLQDTVRELGLNVGHLHGTFSDHKRDDVRKHKVLRLAFIGLSVVTLIGLILNFEAVGRLLELIIKWVT